MNLSELPARLFRSYDKQPRVIVAATFFVVLVCFSLIALDCWRTWQDRGLELHESEIVASNLARSFADDAQHVVANTDTALLSLVEKLELLGAGKASRDRLYTQLSAYVADSSWLQELSVYDENGRVLVDSKVPPAPILNAADSEFFIYHRSHSDIGPHIGQPMQSGSAGHWTVAVSRRVNHPDGSFAGVALANVSMDYFQKYYAGFNVGRQGVIVLARDTGMILVRSPQNKMSVGSNLASDTLFRNYVSKPQAGTAMITSASDGVERLHAYWHLVHYPLVVDVALSKDEILSKWLTSAYLHGIGVGFLVIVLGALGIRLVGQIGLRLQAERKLSDSERRLRTITDNIPAFIAYIDRDERYRFCNALYLSEYNLSMDKLLGSKVSDIFDAAAYASLSPYIAQALAGQKVVFERHTMERGQGTYSLYHYVPDTDATGAVRGFYVMVLDISLRRNAELQLLTKEKLLRGLTDHLPALVSYIDLEERFQFVNQRYEKWLGKPLSEITAHSVREACGDDEYFKYKRFLDQAVAGKRTDFAFASVRDGGKRYYSAAYIPQFDEDGRVVGVCSMINDITELKQVEFKLIKLARIDALTGLPNRVQFDENVRKAMGRSRRSGLSMALMYLDIDRFKAINDTYGHLAGDQALCEFANRLAAAVRKTDSVSRLSGDEFVIILEDMKTEDEAEIVAQKIIQAMESRFLLVGDLYQVTTSIGIAILRDDDMEPQSLLRRADQALYRAKSGGRNGYQLAEG